MIPVAKSSNGSLFRAEALQLLGVLAHRKRRARPPSNSSARLSISIRTMPSTITTWEWLCSSLIDSRRPWRVIAKRALDPGRAEVHNNLGYTASPGSARGRSAASKLWTLCPVRARSPTAAPLLRLGQFAPAADSCARPSS